jgi:hypothetical protein
MAISDDINPKTGLPYKTTPKQRLQSRKQLAKIYSDSVLKAKYDKWRYHWRKNPKELKRAREYMRKHNLSPKRIFEIVKYNAEKRKIPININEYEFTTWWNNSSNNCYYCKRELQAADEFFGKRTGRLSVDRIENQKGYELDNIVKACWLCNRIKADIFTKDEMLEIGKVISTLKRFNQLEVKNE